MLGQGIGIAKSSQGILAEMADEVADVQGRIALREEVQVEEINAAVVDDNLIMIEIAVDWTGRRRMNGLSGGRTSTQQALKPFLQMRVALGDQRQLFTEESELVRNGVQASWLNLALVKLEDRLGKTNGNIRLRIRCKDIDRGRTGHSPLKPHLQWWDHG